MSEPQSGLDPVEVLAEEFAERYRRGERPALTEYIQKHPHLAEQIRELFPAVVVMERLGSVEAPVAHVEGEKPGDRREVPQQLGEYRILREVGHGGMGVVYEAVQESLGRHVALKILPFHGAVNAGRLERFRREARAAARLHHTNIVPVFGVGEADGIHFFAMQFIRGQGLHEVLHELKRLRRQRAATETAADRPAAAPQAQQVQNVAQGVAELARVPLAQNVAQSVAQSLLSGQWQAGGNLSAAAKLDDASAPSTQLFSPPTPQGSRGPIGSFKLSGSGSEIVAQVAQAAQTEQQYFRGVAQIGEQAAEALEYAHRQRILHRDIKPSNLLLDAQGTVWVSDFGLAKAEADEEITHTGDIVGTVRYMGPERFRGLADARSDVYGLGITLYELLTLEPAFEGSDPVRLIERVKEEEPVRPRRIDARIPRDLETIVLSAIEKQQDSRYQTAGEMALELRRFLAGEPIKRRPIGFWERGLKWAKRRPAAAALVLVSALALLVFLAGSLVANALLNSALQTARQNEREKNRQLADAHFKEAQANRFSGRMGRRFESLELIKKAAAIYDSLGELTEERKLELRNEAIACLALVDLKKGQEWEVEPNGKVKGIFDSPLEYYTVAYPREPSSGSAQGYVSVRRVTDHQEIARLPGPVDCAWSVLSPDCRYLAIAYGTRHPTWEFWLWDLQRGEPVWKLPAGVSLGCRFSPDGRVLAFFHHTSGEIVFCEVPSGKITRRMARESVCFDFTPDGRRLAIASAQKPYKVRIVNLATEEVITLPCEALVRDLGWRGDGRMLAVACGADDAQRFHAYVWDLEAPAEPRAVLKGHQAEVVRVAFNHAGDLLVTTSWDGTMRFWDAWTGRQLLTTSSTDGSYPSFSPDDCRLGYAFAGQKVWLWDVATGREFRTFHGHTGYKQPYGIDICPDGRLMASSDESCVRLWDLSAVREWDKPAGQLAVGHSYSVMFDPRGDSLITAGRGAGLQRWPIVRVADGLRIGPPERVGTSAPVSYGVGALSLDGRTVAFAPTRPAGLVFDLNDPKRKTALLGHDLEEITVSPDGKWVAAGGFHNHKGTPVWDARSGELVKLLPHPYRSRPRFSADGRWLTTMMSGETRFWEVATWQPAHAVQPKEPNTQAYVFAFSRDGQMAAVYHLPGGLIQLIDPGTGREFATLEPPDPQAPNLMSFSPDGGQLAVGCATQVIQVWNLRLIRQQLAEMGLDWNLPAFRAAPESREPLKVTVDLGDQAKPLPLKPSSKSPEELRAQQLLYTLLAGLSPLHPEPVHQRGHVHEQLGQGREAIADFTAALALEPQPARRAHLFDARAKNHLRLQEYLQAIADWEESLALKPEQPEVRKALAQAANNRAWRLSTGPEEERDPSQAVPLAQQAVRQAKEESNYWNTLGVAHYRAGEWEAAIKALEESERLAPGKHFSFNAFFLAMCHHQLGDPARAKDYYDRAVLWCQENQSKLPAAHQEELKRFRAEAEEFVK